VGASAVGSRSRARVAFEISRSARGAALSSNRGPDHDGRLVAGACLTQLLAAAAAPRVGARARRGRGAALTLRPAPARRRRRSRAGPRGAARRGRV